MTNLPANILHVFTIFTPLFSNPVYKNALQLFCGHILCKGRRTVTEILRQLRLKNIKNYSKYHWVLAGAKWSSLGGSKILLKALCKLCPGPIIFSFDSTVERRKGTKIKGLGRQRDAVNSTKDNKVLTIGLNWLVCAIHVTFPWSTQSWACPFLTILMPPKKPLRSSKNQSDLNNKKRHKPLNTWAGQAVYFIIRCIGKYKDVTIVADSAFATYHLANICIDLGVNLISRMRLDARTFDFPAPVKKGRPRLVGKRLPTFNELACDPNQKWEEVVVKWYSGTTEKLSILTGKCIWYGYGIRPVPIKWVLTKRGNEVTVLFSTNLKHSPQFIIETFVGRWKIETTFEETRRHLGMETQRQWSDRAIDVTTPIILASYSIINLMAYELVKNNDQKIPIQTTSWYKKEHVCFSDVICCLRQQILEKKYLSHIDKNTDLEKNLLYDLMTLLAAA